MTCYSAPRSMVRDALLCIFIFIRKHWNIDFYRWKYLSIESILENKNSFIPLGIHSSTNSVFMSILIDLFKKRDSNFPLAINPITGKWSQNSNQSTETNTEPFTLHIDYRLPLPLSSRKRKTKSSPEKRIKERKEGRKKVYIRSIHRRIPHPSISISPFFFFFSPSSKPRSISIIPVYSALNRRA